MQAERIGHSSTTLLRVSKNKFSKAKQTGMLRPVQPKRVKCHRLDSAIKTQMQESN